jgi:hypothetical protein
MVSMHMLASIMVDRGFMVSMLASITVDRGFMVSMLASIMVDRGFMVSMLASIPSLIKPKTIKLVFVAFLIRTQH